MGELDVKEKLVRGLSPLESWSDTELELHVNFGTSSFKSLKSLLDLSLGVLEGFLDGILNSKTLFCSVTNQKLNCFVPGFV